MTRAIRAYAGPEIFDGFVRRSGHALVVEAGKVVAIQPLADIDPALPVEHLNGGVIFPGFVDLQVNGGGGVMLNDEQSPGSLRRMTEAHATLGATSILPTLITDTPDKTRASIDAVEMAIAEAVPGILGLHLEGPHLSVSRKGAHEPGFIRRMTENDVTVLLDAAARLPLLKVTVAVESVTPAQIRRLADVGVLVSLGHSDASFSQCAEAVTAGASCATHLFNAMSQLGNREPGLVGAVLSIGGLAAGLIADGVHVHPESIRAAMRAKCGPGQIFLVSDAMAVAGTSNGQFELGGRTVLRKDRRLTLENGTLAGADLDLLTAVRNLVRWGITDQDTALAMATEIPARVAGVRNGIGTLRPGGPADFQHALLDNSEPAVVWKSGKIIDAHAP